MGKCRIYVVRWEKKKTPWVKTVMAIFFVVHPRSHQKIDIDSLCISCKRFKVTIKSDRNLELLSQVKGPDSC